MPDWQLVQYRCWIGLRISLRIVVAALALATLLAACEPSTSLTGELPTAYQILTPDEMDRIAAQGMPVYTPGEDLKAFARKHLDWMFGPNADPTGRHIFSRPIGLSDSEYLKFDEALKALADEGHQGARLMLVVSSNDDGANVQTNEAQFAALAAEGFAPAVALAAMDGTNNPRDAETIANLRMAASKWPPGQMILGGALMQQPDLAQREEGVRLVARTMQRSEKFRLTDIAAGFIQLDPAPPLADQEARRMLEAVVADKSDHYSDEAAWVLLAELLELGRGGHKDVKRAIMLYTATIEMVGNLYDERAHKAADALKRLGAPLPALPGDEPAAPDPATVGPAADEPAIVEPEAAPAEPAPAAPPPPRPAAPAAAVSPPASRAPAAPDIVGTSWAGRVTDDQGRTIFVRYTFLPGGKLYHEFDGPDWSDKDDNHKWRQTGTVLEWTKDYPDQENEFQENDEVYRGRINGNSMRVSAEDRFDGSQATILLTRE